MRRAVLALYASTVTAIAHAQLAPPPPPRPHVWVPPPPSQQVRGVPTGRSVLISRGVEMPSVSLGTCCGSDPKVGLPVWLEHAHAANQVAGVDTALDYGDQAVIADVLKKVSGKPDKCFITTKVPTHHGCENKGCTAAYALARVQDDRDQLKVGDRPLDLVLLHHPAASPAENRALWTGLEQAVRQNLVRAIGVSNFNHVQIDALLRGGGGGIRPAVNQCELSVGGQDTQCGNDRDEAIAYHRAQNITFEAWSPLSHCEMDDHTLRAIASAHNVSVAQVCLRWILERGCTLTVGTGTDRAKVEQYTREDLGLWGWNLSMDEMAQLDGLARAEHERAALIIVIYLVTVYATNTPQAAPHSAYAAQPAARTHALHACLSVGRFVPRACRRFPHQAVVGYAGDMRIHVREEAWLLRQVQSIGEGNAG